MPKKIMVSTPLNNWAKYCNDWAERKGWNNREIPVMESLMLFVTEIAEAAEEYRVGHIPTEIYFNDDECVNGHEPKPEGIPVEIADLLIRVFHFCGLHGIDLDEVVRMKMAYNEGRPYRHGDKLA